MTPEEQIDQIAGAAMRRHSLRRVAEVIEDANRRLGLTLELPELPVWTQVELATHRERLAQSWDHIRQALREED